MSIDELREKLCKETHPPQREKIREAMVKKILAYLNAACVRCTYGAVGKVIKTYHRSVSAYLGKPRPEASWVVKQRNGEPTGYECVPKPPGFKGSYIIRCGDELMERMRRWKVK